MSTITAETYIVEDHAQNSTYVDGKRQGMTLRYNGKGAIKSKVNFDNDKENALYTSSYDNRKVKLTVKYVMGLKHGIQKIYYNEETLIDLAKYGLMPKNTSEKERIR